MYDRRYRRTDVLDGRNPIGSADWRDRRLGYQVIGSSHDISQTRCQDAHAMAYARAGGDTVIIVVAARAGSATYSHLGARTATDCAAGLVGEASTSPQVTRWARRSSRAFSVVSAMPRR